MTQLIEIEKQNFSFLSMGSKVTGSFELKGPTHLAGHIEGDIVVTDDYNFVIEANGSLVGTINCYHIEIYGYFKGTLKSSGTAVFYPSANVTGDITADNIVIHPGAVINMDVSTVT